MKKVAFVVALLGCSLVYAQAIEHAPTVDQCIADANLWKAQVEEYDKASDSERLNTTVSKLTIPEIGGRQNEMSQCVHVDQPWNDRSLTYGVLLMNYGNIISDRYFQYIERHHLNSDVLREDKDGLR